MLAETPPPPQDGPPIPAPPDELVHVTLSRAQWESVTRVLNAIAAELAPGTWCEHCGDSGTCIVCGNTHPPKDPAPDYVQRQNESWRADNGW